MPTTTMLEVEEKYVMPTGVDLEGILLQLGFARQQTVQETDTYFTDAAGAYIRDRTCLRIRSVPDTDTVSVDFKGKSPSLKGAYAKQETNLVIPRAQMAGQVGLWANLGFYRYVDVVKTRTTYRKTEGTITLNVTIDELLHAGGFIELEALSDPRDNGADIMWERLQCLRQDMPVILQPADVPYRDYAAWHRKAALRAPTAILLDVDSFALPLDGGGNAPGLRALSQLLPVLAVTADPARGAALLQDFSDVKIIGTGQPSLPTALLVTADAAKADTFRQRGDNAALIAPGAAGNSYDSLMQLYLLLNFAMEI